MALDPHTHTMLSELTIRNIANIAKPFARQTSLSRSTVRMASNTNKYGQGASHATGESAVPGGVQRAAPEGLEKKLPEGVGLTSHYLFHEEAF